MNDRVPLLVLTELFLPTKGGTAVWFAEVYRRLGGKEIHVITASVPGAQEIDASHPNTIHRLNLKRFFWLKPESFMMYWRFFVQALRLTFQHHFKMIHAGRVLPEGLVAWLVARIGRIPVVTYAHGEEITTWRQPVKFKVMRFVYSHVDKIVANSEFTREQLLRIGVASERIVIINPGVDTGRFKPDLPCEDLKASIGLMPTQKLILSVGRLSRRKGFDMVIHSLSGLLKRGIDVRYALIGIGADNVYLHDLAKKNGVLDRVHLLGDVAPQDLPRWYNACDVFAMPNRDINGDTEGFGMVFIEATACGKPSLAGIAGGTGAAVLEGQTGYRVDGNKHEAVSDALYALLSNRQLALDMGQSGVQRVQREFSWEVVAARTMSVITTMTDH